VKTLEVLFGLFSIPHISVVSERYEKRTGYSITVQAVEQQPEATTTLPGKGIYLAARTPDRLVAEQRVALRD
jgi:hypothetical protein